MVGKGSRKWGVLTVGAPTSAFRGGGGFSMCVRFEYQNILNINREKHLKMETEFSKQCDPAFGQQCKDGFRAGLGASLTASNGSLPTPLWSFPNTLHLQPRLICRKPRGPASRHMSHRVCSASVPVQPGCELGHRQRLGLPTPEPRVPVWSGDSANCVHIPSAHGRRTHTCPGILLLPDLFIVAQK